MTIMQREPPTKAVEPTVYPESDGKPMAESDLHREIMIWIIHLLQRFFAGQPVYVSGNLLIYYEQGNPRKSVAPDCFVVWDVEPHYRGNYKLWEEGQVPQVVFEISSKTTQRDDLGVKMRLYAQLGVQEYYLYDPTGDYLEPPLAAFQLVGGGFVPMQPVNEEVRVGDLAFLLGAGKPPEFISPRLGLRLALDQQNRLQFYDVTTGQRLLSDDEARQQAEAEARLASLRASAAEAELNTLRAEVTRLRGELS